MSDISTKATVTLNVNGESARKELTELENKIESTSKRVDYLKEKIKDKEAFKDAKDSVATYSKELEDLKIRLKAAVEHYNELKDSGASKDDLKNAREAVKSLKNEVRQTTENLKRAKSELADFDPKTLEKAKHELKGYQSRLEHIQAATVGVNRALENLDKATPKELEKTLRALNKEFRNAEQGSEAYYKLAANIRAVKEQLASVREELNESTTPWERFKNWATDVWPALDLIAKGYDALVSTMREYVDAYADMDQEMASVRKFTGMTSDEVGILNEEFMRMDTRSSREQLNILAQEAGRLGKQSVEDALGFVRAADKVNVALDDLGKGATLTLSKLTGTFGVEEIYGTERSLLKVGSVINELSQNCSASAPYLTDFTERMAGVGVQAGMTIQQIMGYGAVLDENSQAVEASATALSQVLVRLYQDPSKYARVAGLEVESFSKLLREDANSALILFLDTLNKAGGMDVLSPMFKDMGETGSRAISALSTLAQNIDRVKAQQEAANMAFLEGTSIDEEFAVQNNTVAASIDKCRKVAHELKVELGEKLYPLMGHFMSSGSAVMHGMLTTVNFLMQHKVTIVTLTVAVSAYIAAMKIQALWLDRVALKTAFLDKTTKLFAASSKALNGIISVGRLAVVALSNAFMFLRNGLHVTTAMQERWKKSMAAMSFGSWTGLIIGVASAVALLYQRLSKLSESEQMISDIRKKASAQLDEQKTKINKMVEAAQDESRSLEERHGLIAKLNSIIPDYNAQIDETTGKYKASTEALELYLQSLARQYEIEGAREKLQDLGREKADAREELANAQEKYDRSRDYVDTASASPYSSLITAAGQQAYLKGLDQSVSSAEKKLESILEREKKLLKLYGTDIHEAMIKEFLEEPEDVTASQTQNSPTDSPYVSAALADKERKAKEAEDRKAAAKARKEFREALDRIKGDRAQAETDAMANRSAGLINYREYLEAMRAAEVKYYEEASRLYIDHGLEEDEDHKSLLKKRQEDDDKYYQKRLVLRKEAVEREAKISELDAAARYNAKDNKSLADELAYEEEVFTIRYQKLMDLQSLHLKGSKEWEDYEGQLQDLLYEDREKKQRFIIDKVSEYQRKFDKQSVADRYKLEYAAIEELFRRKKISESQYREWISKLRLGESEELPGAKPATAKSNAEASGKEYDTQKRELDQALAEGQISQEEYGVRISRIKGDLRNNLLAPLRDAKSEWVSLMATMIGSWKDFADALNDPDADPLSKLSSGIVATAAIMSAVMSQMTAMMQAELAIQTSKIESRYDREIELAEGNSYRVAKLEKEKEEELAKAKNEANRKMFAMQVIQAVAQTATNALNAYGSAAAIPVVGHILAPIAAAMAVAAGAVQIAAIKKQQQASEAQGYSDGGFTKPGRKDEPAGIVHAGEWVASQKLLASPVARPMIEALDYAQRTNTIGSLRSEDVSRSITAGQTISMIAGSDPSAALVAAAIASNSKAVAELTKRLREPFVTVNTVTGTTGIKQAQDEYSTLIRNKSPKSRRASMNYAL